MGGGVDFLQLADRDVDVDLRAAKVGMAKRKGDAQIVQSAAPLHEPNRETVGQ